MTINLTRQKARDAGMALICLLAGTLIWQQAAAQSDIAGASDHPLLERFPGSTIVGYDTDTEVNYNLILGNLRRVGGRVVPEEAQRLRGKLTKITYQAPEAFASDDVFAFFEEQVSAAGYTTLFQCAGRGCGNSNYWANDIFNNRFLYGPERSQYYMALEVTAEGRASDYVVAYVITRANRRLLAYVEILETGPAPAINITLEALTTSLEQTGSLIIDGLEFDNQDRLVNNEGVGRVVDILNLLQPEQAAIVVHLRGDLPLDQAVGRSQRRAEQVLEALADTGFDISDLSAHGVGPLAPFCSGADCSERVELVLP